MKYILSFIVAFGVAVIAGMILIPVLRRLKAGQMIREDGPTWHMSKQGTPSMGGLMFIFGIAVAVVVAGMETLAAGNSAHLVVFLFALVFGLIGLIDDIQKLRHRANEGLSAAQKFLLQLAAGFLHLLGHLADLVQALPVSLGDLSGHVQMVQHFEEAVSFENNGPIRDLALLFHGTDAQPIGLVEQG